MLASKRRTTPATPQEHRNEDEIVAVGQPLQDPRDGEEDEPSPAAALHEAVRSEKDERDEVGGKDLQVGEVGGAIGSETVGEASYEAQARPQPRARPSRCIEKAERAKDRMKVVL